MSSCDMFTAALLGAALAMPPQMEQVLDLHLSKKLFTNCTLLEKWPISGRPGWKLESLFLLEIAYMPF